MVMNEHMKILMAYDGSSAADAALDDLRWAGLPRESEALLLTHGGRCRAATAIA
jgi:hypothetical protein